MAFAPQNPQLYGALKGATLAFVTEFIHEGKDFNSDDFIGRFSYMFIDEHDRLNLDAECRRQILSAGFLPEYEEKTRDALRLLLANSSGWTTEGLFCRLVNDFLNYVIPRVGNLTDWEQRFNDFYKALEDDVYGDSIGVSIIGVLKNVYDHSASARPSGGLSFHWWSKMNSPFANASFRERVIPFFEISASMEGRREPTDPAHAFFGFEFKERIPKPQFLKRLPDRVGDVTRRLVLTLRLLLMAGVYVEYRGARFAGRLSSARFRLVDYPDDVIEGADSRDLQSYAGVVERLFPVVLACPYSRLAVIDHKIEDALRRIKRSWSRGYKTQVKPALDMLLDYCQALESVVEVEGSYDIALYASLLLSASGNRGLGATTAELFEFFKGMYRIRNDIMHGRIDDVLNREAKSKSNFDIYRLRYYVHQIAVLHVLNDDLKQAAHRLALGEHVELMTLRTLCQR